MEALREVVMHSFNQVVVVGGDQEKVAKITRAFMDFSNVVIQFPSLGETLSSLFSHREMSRFNVMVIADHGFNKEDIDYALANNVKIISFVRLSFLDDKDYKCLDKLSIDDISELKVA